MSCAVKDSQAVSLKKRGNKGGLPRSRFLCQQSKDLEIFPDETFNQGVSGSNPDGLTNKINQLSQYLQEGEPE